MLSLCRYVAHLQDVSGPQGGVTWDDVPTASVRSVGVFQGIGCGVSPEREGEGRRVGPVAVKEKIFEVEHMNSVSMPSTLFVGAGTDEGRFTVRAGRVKLRRPLLGLGLRACGACSEVWDDAEVDIMGILRRASLSWSVKIMVGSGSSDRCRCVVFPLLCCVVWLKETERLIPSSLCASERDALWPGDRVSD